MQIELGAGLARARPLGMGIAQRHFLASTRPLRHLGLDHARLPPADVRPGTERDALLFSISCNGAHGLPRTNADKHKAVTLLLADAEWNQWSDREIARRCQASHVFVHQVRRSASGNGYQMGPRKVRRGATGYAMRAESSSSQLASPDRGG